MGLKYFTSLEILNFWHIYTMNMFCVYNQKNKFVIIFLESSLCLLVKFWTDTECNSRRMVE